jgi:hypothetical protein
VSDETEGWAWPANSRKAHYFREGRSLCSRWMILYPPDQGTDGDHGPDDCKACWKKIDRERAKAATSPRGSE